MRIGIDFDNTIACYDGVFHAAALERRLIEPTVPHDKNSVRDHLNSTGRKDAFTELQGYVYGARMDLVAPYQGALDFVAAADAAGHDLFVISHKTAAPMLGPRYDLHAAARRFLDTNAFIEPGGKIPNSHVFFELTKEAKLARAATLAIDIFIDDLPEILSMPGWAPDVRKVLFDPDSRFPGADATRDRFERVSSWVVLRHLLLGI